MGNNCTPRIKPQRCYLQNGRWNNRTFLHRARNRRSETTDRQAFRSFSICGFINTSFSLSTRIDLRPSISRRAAVLPFETQNIRENNCRRMRIFVVSCVFLAASDFVSHILPPPIRRYSFQDCGAEPRKKSISGIEMIALAA